MTIFERFKKRSMVGVTQANQPEGLADIHQSDCAAALWRRTPADPFQTWIDALPADQLPRTRTILRPDAVRDAAEQVCNLCGTPDGPMRTLLIDDAAALADMFAHTMKAEFLRLRFDVVTSNSCRKFHIDAVVARLICTYRGTGTQIGVGRKGQEPSEILTVPTGSPIVLRGTLWPEIPSSGLLHRSPPIEGTGESRLLFVLDPIFDIEDQPEHEYVH